jgi:outer membrane protein assembly factor BamA
LKDQLPSSRRLLFLAVLLVAAAAAGGPAGAQEPPRAGPLPSFEEMEAAGARIGEIRIMPEDIFDLSDPRENNRIYRLANRLHMNTRPEVIRRILLFEAGEPLQVRLIEESERLLRANRYLYDVVIQPTKYENGVVDIEVRTRDTWSLEPYFSVGRAGGHNSGRVGIEEDNLLGTGVLVNLQYRKDVDRSSTEFNIANNNVLGTRATLAYSIAKQDDGMAQSVALNHPFYALDTRWAAGISASRSDAVDAIYNSGSSVAEYEHRRRSGEAFAGWSPGLQRGWARRYSIGVLHEEDDYETLEGHTAPVRLPPDFTLTGPFLRFQLVEDAFRKDTNLNSIGRIEDVSMGVQGTLQVGRALGAFGASRELWFYRGGVTDGFDVTSSSIVLTTWHFGGRYAGGQSENQSVGGAARYYQRQGRHILYYAAASADAVHDPDVPGPLTIGGDNGLRGYPLRYQSGERRALMTLEARVYSDWYPLRLVRVGGAVFYDVGRAWRGENRNLTNPGWLSDVGFGLRFLNARTAFGNVLHADIAFPLDREGDIKSVQFVLRTKIAL